MGNEGSEIASDDMEQPIHNTIIALDLRLKFLNRISSSEVYPFVSALTR